MGKLKFHRPVKISVEVGVVVDGKNALMRLACGEAHYPTRGEFKEWLEASMADLES